MALLNKSKDLRRFPTLKSICTNPDLTRNQRETNRTLRQELKKRKEAGEDVISFGGEELFPSKRKKIFENVFNLHLPT